MRDGNQGFGKRGRVEITREPRQPDSPPPSETSWMKYAAGGIAAIFLFGLIMGGTGGGGGLLGGILGGLLGHHLGKKMSGPTATATPAPAPSASAAHTGAVQRGGFGSTGSSSGFGSFFGG